MDWCNLCQSKPAQGRLTIIVDGDDHEVVVDACEDCAMKSLDKWNPLL